MNKFFAASMAVAIALTAGSAFAEGDGDAKKVADGDAKKGAKVFKKCKACHKLEKNSLGPKLGGVVGRPAGTAEDFKYSDAVKNSGITWTKENIAKWLDKSAGGPKAFIPGTKMGFKGFKKKDIEKGKVADLIAFLSEQEGED